MVTATWIGVVPEAAAVAAAAAAAAKAATATATASVDETAAAGSYEWFASTVMDAR